MPWVPFVIILVIVVVALIGYYLFQNKESVFPTDDRTAKKEEPRVSEPVENTQPTVEEIPQEPAKPVDPFASAQAPEPDETAEVKTQTEEPKETEQEVDPFKSGEPPKS